jgi:hypothetical protein
MGHGRDPADAIGHPEAGRLFPDPGQLGLALGPRRAADDDQRGVLALDAGQHVDSHPEALEGLDPADEQQHRLLPQSEGAAGPPLVARREEGVVHAGRHDLDAIGRGVVEDGQLALLGGAGGADHVRAPDDRGLGLGPALGLGVTVLGLDPGEGVEGRHQGQFEAVLQLVAGQARQPVVGVDHVDGLAA